MNNTNVIHVVGKWTTRHATAKYMPELCRLSHVGIKLMDTGLGAILDGCPHLESLDRRQCLNVNLNVSDLAKKWVQLNEDLKRSTINNDKYEDYYSDYISGLDFEYCAEFSNYFGFLSHTIYVLITFV